MSKSKSNSEGFFITWAQFNMLINSFLCNRCGNENSFSDQKLLDLAGKTKEHFEKKKRKIKIDQFDYFTEFLSQEHKVVAHLLYFGGSRTLKEVLDIKIEEVDFEKYMVNYNGINISYSKNEINYLRLIVKKRTSGWVFLGRQERPLNPSTIFRAFKKAARCAKIQGFTTKDLTIDV